MKYSNSKGYHGFTRDKNSNIAYLKKCDGKTKVETNQLTRNQKHLVTYLQQDPDWRDEKVIDGCDRSIHHPRGTYELRLQCDGNLVLKKHEDGFIHKLWAGVPDMAQGRPKYLKMQWDGNLVMYREDGQAMWASHTMANVIRIGGEKRSFVMQGDGNLVIYDNDHNGLDRRPIWSSGTFPGAQKYDKPIMWNHFTDRPNKTRWY